MARPLRIDFPNAVHHVTSRGDRRELIFSDDIDRQRLLDILGLATARFGATVLAYCLMGNHYHFVLRMHEAKLSRLMRHVNGVYTQAFNRRHGVAGHLFQGRFKAILVDSDSYLLAVCRHVELNPVRAGLVQQAGEWAWSSYRAHVGLMLVPAWLDTAAVRGMALGRFVDESRGDQDQAVAAYASHVAGGVGVRLWETELRQQIYLGSEAFVQRMQEALPAANLARVRKTADIPRQQRSMSITLQQWLAGSPSRGAALMRAYRESGISMTAMAAELGLSVSRVSRLIATAETKLDLSMAKGKT